jgi:hypothetical protein
MWPFVTFRSRVLLVVQGYLCSNFGILLTAQCAFSSNLEIIRRKAKD